VLKIIAGANLGKLQDNRYAWVSGFSALQIAYQACTALRLGYLSGKEGAGTKGGAVGGKPGADTTNNESSG
jgi:hypothetical protein